MTSTARIAILLSICGVACSPDSPDSPGPLVQSLADTYAPGLRIGEPVSEGARQRYQLRVSPYLGYRDTSFVSIDGLRDLSVTVDENVDDSNPKVSPNARIEAVSLRSRDAATTALLESKLRAALGPPGEWCYMGTSNRWRRLYWAGDGGRGVQLLVVLPYQLTGQDKSMDSIIAQLAAPPGTGSVVFGAETPSDKEFAPTPCA